MRIWTTVESLIGIEAIQNKYYDLYNSGVIDILKPIKNKSSYMLSILNDMENKEDIAKNTHKSRFENADYLGRDGLLFFYLKYNDFLYEEENSDTVAYYENWNLHYKEGHYEYEFSYKNVDWTRHLNPTSMKLTINKKRRYFPLKDSYIRQICKDVGKPSPNYMKFSEQMSNLYRKLARDLEIEKHFKYIDSKVFALREYQ